MITAGEIYHSASTCAVGTKCALSSVLHRFFCCDCHVCRHHRDRCLWLVCSSCTARLTAVKTNNPGVHFQETVLCSLYALCTVHSITVGMIRAVSHWHGVSVNF